MSLDRSTAAVRAVNEFGLSQSEAADLFDVSQSWVARELEKHDEEDGDGADTCPVCGDTYDHKREVAGVSGGMVLRSDATQCKVNPDYGHKTTYYVHRGATSTTRTTTSPASGVSSPPGGGHIGIPPLGPSEDDDDSPFDFLDAQGVSEE